MVPNKTYIIAEAGVNHNGDLRIAKKLIAEAKKCGADAVKFQTFKAEKLVTSKAKKAKYQVRNTGNEESQYQMLKRLELSYENHIVLIEYCRNKSIQFISSPFDEESFDLLCKLRLNIIKIPSGEITNIPFLKYIAKAQKEIILSTGMSTLNEVKDSVNVLKPGSKKISLLHCVTEYPAPYEEINLSVIKTLKKNFKIPVGYSDHTEGIEISIAAVALGAEIIEKHFTLDKKMIGPDHKASIEPDEFRKMVNEIRNVEKSLGDGIKRPAGCEIKNIEIVRKSIVALRDIKKGESFSKENLICKRPGNGISPIEFNNILGLKAKRDFEKDELIKL